MDNSGTKSSVANLSLTPGRSRSRINIRCDNCTIQKKGCFIYAGESTCTKCIEKGKSCKVNGVPVTIQEQRNFEGPGPREKQTEQSRAQNPATSRPKAITKSRIPQSQAGPSNTLSTSRFSRSNLQAESQSNSSAQPNLQRKFGKSESTSRSEQGGLLPYQDMPPALRSSRRLEGRLQDDTRDEIEDEERPMKIAKYTHPSHIVTLGCCIDESTGKASFMGWDEPTPIPNKAGSGCNYSRPIPSHPLDDASIRSYLEFNPFAASHSSHTANPSHTTAALVLDSEDELPQYVFNRPILCCKKVDSESTDFPKQNSHGMMMAKWAKQNSGLEAKEFVGWEDTTVWGKYKYIIFINKLASKNDLTMDREICYIGCNSLAKHDFVEINMDDPHTYPEIVTMADLKQLYYGENARFKNKACLVQEFAAAHLYCEAHGHKFTVGEAKYYPAYSSIDHSALSEVPEDGFTKEGNYIMNGIEYEQAGPWITETPTGMGLQGSGFDVKVYEAELAGKKGKGKAPQVVTNFNDPHYNPERFAESRGFTYNPKTNMFTIPDSAYDLVRDQPSMYSDPETFFTGRKALNKSLSSTSNDNASSSLSNPQYTYTLGDEYRLSGPIDWSFFPGPQPGQPGFGGNESLPNPGALGPDTPPHNVQDEEDLWGGEILEENNFFEEEMEAMGFDTVAGPVAEEEPEQLDPYADPAAFGFLQPDQWRYDA